MSAPLPHPAELRRVFGDSLDPAAAARLGRLAVGIATPGDVLFRPGDSAGGFVLVLDGRVGVYLTGQNGREILLYDVSPGETCVQTTLGLMTGTPYSGEAVAERTSRIVMVPDAEFHALVDQSPGFRSFVFRAFAARLQEMMRLLESVAFLRIETRLARRLLELADDEGRVAATHQALASAIGSAREVVSRRLEQLRRDGIVLLERGEIRLADRAALEALARAEGPAEDERAGR